MQNCSSLGAPGEADDGQCLWTIKQNCNHLLGLIDGFLGQSRAHEHNVDAVLSCVRVAEVVTESAEICRSQAKAKGIELHIELDESAPEWIITDALRLRQILLNLLGNAIRHTDAGQVRIAFDGGSGSADEPVLIRVADTGCGIAFDELERIFEPSYQSPRSKKVGSAGLGLAICRELAASLGGDITVTSRQGVGSEFVVSIPRHLSFVIDNTIPHEASASVDPTPLEERPSSSPKTAPTSSASSAPISVTPAQRSSSRPRASACQSLPRHTQPSRPRARGHPS